MADTKRLHAALQTLVEERRHAFLHEDARTGAANLALVEPNGVHHTLNGAVDVGIVKDDERRFAAEFQRQRLAGAGGAFANEPADLRRACKGDLVDIRMLDDQRAGFALAGHDVQHTGRQTGSGSKFSEEQRR
ncbi:hypothetical protein D9M72_511930 [compost metagenome]